VTRGTGGPGLEVAERYYEQGGTKPPEAWPLFAVDFRLLVEATGEQDARDFANRLAETLIAETHTLDVVMSVTPR
jgi:hypothetical protein